jgi:DnaJ-class molecular chaperone
MPSMACPACNGTGYAQEEGDATPICSRCEGTGVLFVDEELSDVREQRWADPS